MLASICRRYRHAGLRKRASGRQLNRPQGSGLLGTEQSPEDG